MLINAIFFIVLIPFLGVSMKWLIKEIKRVDGQILRKELE